MKQGANFPKRERGESMKDYYERIRKWSRGDDVRSKTDLRDWTGSLPFHLDTNRQ